MRIMSKQGDAAENEGTLEPPKRLFMPARNRSRTKAQSPWAATVSAISNRPLGALSLWLLVCAAGIHSFGEALAQAYPTRPIRLLVGITPGGATDGTARTVGGPLGARLGQNVVNDNRPGSNGNIAAEIAAKAPPNGHTLLYANDTLLVTNPHIYSKMPIDPSKDLVPIATLISNQYVLAASPSVVPAKDFRGFIEFARRASPPLFYASIGNGSQHHLAMELLKLQANINLAHVPYKGGAPAGIAVMAGENAAMFGAASIVPHIKSGKLKGLAVTGKTRWPTLPELPNIGDFYPGYEITVWHGLFAPVGTPQAIINRLRTEVNAVLMQPDVRAMLVSSGAGEPYITTPEQFAALIRTDYERYGKVIRAIGLKVD